MSHGSVVHFELPADDLKRAQKFYAKTFGWEIMPMPEMGYTMVGTVPSDKDGMPKEPGAINGGMTERDALLAHPVVTINVADIDASLKLVAKNGGKVARKKTAIGPMGFTAYFKDSEGNTVGLFQAPKA
jgi:predicted enzyme related to lactoylglutathione lyase